MPHTSMFFVVPVANIRKMGKGRTWNNPRKMVCKRWNNTRNVVRSGGRKYKKKRCVRGIIMRENMMVANDLVLWYG